MKRVVAYILIVLLAWASIGCGESGKEEGLSDGALPDVKMTVEVTTGRSGRAVTETLEDGQVGEPLNDTGDDEDFCFIKRGTRGGYAVASGPLYFLQVSQSYNGAGEYNALLDAGDDKNGVHVVLECMVKINPGERTGDFSCSCENETICGEIIAVSGNFECLGETTTKGRFLFE